MQPIPSTSADVPDELDARLVILSVDHPHSKEPDSAAMQEAKRILSSRGNSPRIYQNSLIFAAADKTRVQDLFEAGRRYLAWGSIVREAEQLDLTAQQRKQAETQWKAAEDAVKARIPETYKWVLAPVQAKPQSPIEMQALPLSGTEAIAVRASKKLKNDELLVGQLGPTILRKHMDEVPLWRGKHVPVKLLIEDFARYIYLPRLRSTKVLLDCVEDGLRLLTWSTDTFAYADSWDEKAGKYRALRRGQVVKVTTDSPGVLVHPTAAEADAEVATAPMQPFVPGERDLGKHSDGPLPVPEPHVRVLRKFYGSVNLDPDRLGRDAGRIAEEIVQHLTTLRDANVTLTLEIDAELPAGAPDNVVRIVTENARTLKFKSQGFEEA